ncbi:MFS transporter [Sphingomonas sp. G-3-2-10]|uniref:MFS transporter n=1 Tax=Sphingomonas sp. G-3-2-10 TaxID=2728838 RepID=UPI00146A2C53|nr:MFS transporter [Sphingomonas sp. G-3-2-10]NML05792.1 MFS transporter [Sphingomonas sp. G-3-2-10]
MTGAAGEAGAKRVGAFEPLRVPVFRRIWSASVVANFGQLILGVAAAWEMTRLTPDPGMVALVQTALMLPLMLVAVPAGALADMFDRRRIAITGLFVSIACAVTLTLLARAGYTSPAILLVFCFLIGTGVALYTPAWQASIPEQVDTHQLPAAIAMGSISYNVARSVGPALGGLIVLAAGATAAFATNAVCYLPLLLAFFLWRRRHTPSRLPPERIDRAIVSGARYAIHSDPIRTVFIRAFLFGAVGATTTALAPLVARDLLHGDASTYGLLLGAGGVGAVTGALMVGRVRDLLGTERATKLLAIVSGLALLVVGFSHSLVLTCLALFVAGGGNILTIALFNISVQLAAPRWVTARALSLFTSALTGGIAIGAWAWGVAASVWSVDTAILASGVALLLLPLLSLLLPLPEANHGGVETVGIGSEPEVALALTLRSGPIVIEVDYRVDPDDARGFYDAMLKVQRARLRNGGFDWSLSRDIADPTLWTERYHCPTWSDYLRLRDRLSQADIEIQLTADAYILAGEEKQVRRRLERPFGSVRWKPDSPDPQQDTIGYVTP